MMETKQLQVHAAHRAPSSRSLFVGKDPTRSGILLQAAPYGPGEELVTALAVPLQTTPHDYACLILTGVAYFRHHVTLVDTLEAHDVMSEDSRLKGNCG